MVSFGGRPTRGRPPEPVVDFSWRARWTSEHFRYVGGRRLEAGVGVVVRPVPFYWGRNRVHLADRQASRIGKATVDRVRLPVIGGTRAGTVGREDRTANRVRVAPQVAPTPTEIRSPTSRMRTDGDNLTVQPGTDQRGPQDAGGRFDRRSGVRRWVAAEGETGAFLVLLLCPLGMHPAHHRVPRHTDAVCPRLSTTDGAGAIRLNRPRILPQRASHARDFLGCLVQPVVPVLDGSLVNLLERVSRCLRRIRHPEPPSRLGVPVVERRYTCPR